MSLITWTPQHDLDRMFNDHSIFSFPKFGHDLAVDIFEEQDAVVAKMSLPGVTADELDITFEENTLVVSGRREEESETDEKDYYSKEIRRGSFSRSVRLPKMVDAEKAEAQYKDGVLTVSAPIKTGKEHEAIRVEVK